MKLNFHLASVVGAFFLLVATGRAEELPDTKARAVNSLRHGFASTQSLPVLKRGAAGGAEDVATRLVGTAIPRPAASTRTTTGSGRTHVDGGGWYLDVFADGSAVVFVDHDAAARAHEIGVDPGEQLSTADVEALGTAFLKNQLADVLKLGPGEELAPSHVAYRKEAGQRADGTGTQVRVVGNIVTFSRSFGGVPVVGGGSRVVLSFANDGSIESFEYDWPTYAKSTRSQEVVPVTGIFDRLQTVLLGPQHAPLASPVSASYPLRLSSDTELKKLECGYYDPGVRNRDAAAPIQPGCVYHVVSRPQDGSGTRSGRAGAIPGGSKPDRDTKWVEALLLQGLPELGATPPPSAQ